MSTRTINPTQWTEIPVSDMQKGNRVRASVVNAEGPAKDGTVKIHSLLQIGDGDFGPLGGVYGAGRHDDSPSSGFDEASDVIPPLTALCQ